MKIIKKKKFDQVHEKHDLKSPVNWKVEPLSEVKDETFASGVMGKGIAVIPTIGDGKLILLV